MDKVAFLIMCHKEPAQVNRLLAALQDPDAVCFVHVDSRAAFDPSDLRGGVMTDHRFHGVLMTMSLVQIADELMETARRYGGGHGVRFTHFCLLSGQDYPVRPVGEIVHELRETYPRPYIDCTPWSRDNWVGHGSRSTVWWNPLSRRINEAMAGGAARKLVKAVPLALDRLLGRFSDVKRALEKRGVGLYGGSAWWILPDDMAECALGARRELGPGGRFAALPSVAVPEENWYQTVLMNSGFADRIEVNPPDMVGQNCKTYAHFNPEGKPFTGHPYVLTQEDEGLLRELSGSRFFARKFDMGVDAGVLDWIDESLLNRKALEG